MSKTPRVRKPKLLMLFKIADHKWQAGCFDKRDKQIPQLQGEIFVTIEGNRMEIRWLE